MNEYSGVKAKYLLGAGVSSCEQEVIEGYVVGAMPYDQPRPQSSSTQSSEPPSDRRDPTTSFLTTTTLIYAIGAGITAAAGTRLALQ